VRDGGNVERRVSDSGDDDIVCAGNMFEGSEAREMVGGEMVRDGSGRDGELGRRRDKYHEDKRLIETGE
jgi:hypothetical protein